ncbi:MAG: hypothetical protein R2880_03380 [Deinococcales bacterium]
MRLFSTTHPSALISYAFFLLILALSACAPVCEVVPETSFVAELLAFKDDGLFVRLNRQSFELRLSEKSRIYDAEGLVVDVSLLRQGMRLSVRGVLEARAVHVNELRILD